MIKKDTFMYNEELDRLMVFNGIRDDEKVQGSVDIFNMVLDITTKNRIANIEIRNISDYLKSIDKDLSILKNLEEVKINVTQVRGGFVINMVLLGLDKTEIIPFTIPTEREMLITA